MYGSTSGSGGSGGYGSLGAAPVAGRARADPSPFRYHVQAGDTLARIAAKLNTTEKKLLALNPLLAAENGKSKSRVKVYAGQQLVVEEARHVSLPPPPETIDAGWGQMHVMRPGESLRDVAALYNTTEEMLRQDNRQYFPAGERGAVFPGQMLLVRYVNIGQLEPEEEVVPVASSTASSSSSRGSSPAAGSVSGMPTTISKYKSHRLTKKDTFESLCAQYKIDYARLLHINRGRFPVGARAELVVGEQLIVPDLEASRAEESRRNVAEIKLTKQIHVVEEGETPHSVAARFRMSYDELREFNRAFFPKGYRGEIRPGNKLVVKRLEEDEEEAASAQSRNNNRRNTHSDDDEDDDEEDDDDSEDDDIDNNGYNTLA